MGRLKILFVTNTTIPNSRYGGISRLVYNLAKALYKLNNDIIFYHHLGLILILE